MLECALSTEAVIETDENLPNKFDAGNRTLFEISVRRRYDSRSGDGFGNGENEGGGEGRHGKSRKGEETHFRILLEEKRKL